MSETLDARAPHETPHPAGGRTREREREREMECERERGWEIVRVSE